MSSSHVSRVQVTKCVKIPSETCRDVPVAHCKAVPTRTAVLRTVKVTTDNNVTFDENTFMIIIILLLLFPGMSEVRELRGF